MSTEVRKTKIWLFIICYLVAIWLVLNENSIYMILGLLVFPFVINTKEEIKKRDISLDELRSMLMKYQDVEGISSIASETIIHIERYQKLKRASSNIFYVNSNIPKPFGEFERRMDLSEKTMIDAVKKIYSRITLIKAKGYIPEEKDYQYIKRYSDVCEDTINEVSKMINEIPELYHENDHLQSVREYTNCLHNLNNKNTKF